MKGILIISHGKMASGMVDAASMFFGDEIAQMDYLCLEKEDDPEGFGARIEEKAKALDTGDGVVILADLFGGTPCNQAVIRLGEKTELISGMNLAMLIEALSNREFMEVSAGSLQDAGINGIVDVKKRLSDMMAEDD